MAVLRKIFSSLRRLFGRRAPLGRKRKQQRKAKRKVRKKTFSSRRPPRKPLARSRPVRPSSVLSASANRLKTPSAKTLPSGQLVGEVTHFFSKIQVVVVKMGKGNLAVGDKIRIYGPQAPAGRKSTDFTQTVRSMQIESVDVRSARSGQLIGLKVAYEAKAGDRLYKLV